MPEVGFACGQSTAFPHLSLSGIPKCEMHAHVHARRRARTYPVKTHIHTCMRTCTLSSSCRVPSLPSGDSAHGQCTEHHMSAVHMLQCTHSHKFTACLLFMQEFLRYRREMMHVASKLNFRSPAREVRLKEEIYDLGKIMYDCGAVKKDGCHAPF